MPIEIRQQLPSPRADEQLKLKELVRKINVPSGLTPPRPLWFFAEDGDRELGCAYVMVFPDFVTIDYLYVEPHARRKSVGRSLVDDIEAWGKSQGVSRLLTSTIGAQESREFWEKCGFVIIGTSAGANPAQDVLYLEKRI